MVFKLGLVIMVTFASCLADKGYSYVRPNKQLSYDRGYGYKSRNQLSNNNGILGVATDKGYSYVRPNKQLSYDRGYDYKPRDQLSNNNGILGVATDKGYSYVRPNKQLSYDRGYDYKPRDQLSNNNGILGVATDKGYSYVRPNKQLSYDREYDYKPRDQWSNDDGILGVAGKDYPIFYKVPWTRFVCERKHPGYYADPEADCQAYHICQRDGRKDSFLCPNGTLFNQENLCCMWWYTVDCSRAQSFYSINEAVAKAMKEADRRIRIQKLLQSWNQQRDSTENRYQETRLTPSLSFSESADRSSFTRVWDKTWQDGRRGWNKDRTLIRHNQDLDASKQQLPYEILPPFKFSAKTLPNDNTRYNNPYSWKSNYKIGAEKPEKQAASQRLPAFYLPV